MELYWNKYNKNTWHCYLKRVLYRHKEQENNTTTSKGEQNNDNKKQWRQESSYLFSK